MDFGQRVKTQRELLGMTQEELALKVGYKDKSSINKIESGVADITRLKINAIAVALGVSPSYLMGWEQDPGKRTMPKQFINISDLTADQQKTIRDYIESCRKLNQGGRS